MRAHGLLWPPLTLISVWPECRTCWSGGTDVSVPQSDAAPVQHLFEKAKMSMDARDVPGALAIGIGATLVMDLWNLFLKRVFSIPSLNYCLLGRWIRHMPGGTFRHDNIAAAPQKRLECTAGWVAHYTIGLSLAFAFVALASGDWMARPTLLPALLYGIVTVAFPFLVMQPSLGHGIAASRTPSPSRARLKSLMTHTVFGVGLYLCAVAVNYVLKSTAPRD